MRMGIVAGSTPASLGGRSGIIPYHRPPIDPEPEMTTFEPTPHSTVKRHADRASYDRDTVYAILDEAWTCTVGFVHDDRPVVIPTIHVRVDDRLLLHGSPASRMLRTLKQGPPVSIAVTVLDGLVLAKSVFNHSMNYRSVVVFGHASLVEDVDEKTEAMRVFTEKVLPGRWSEARQPSDTEFNGTLMLAVSIEEASAKIRTGPPVDDPEDEDLDVWAGVVPYTLAAGAPVPKPGLDPDLPLPAALR